MRNTARHPLGLLILLLALLLGPHTASAQPFASRYQPPVPIGSAFPEFDGVTVDGAPVALADYRGKVVLVNFWATWCGPCMAELPNLRALHELYQAHGFEILAISLDDERQDLEGFLSVPKNALPWATLFDGKGFDSPLARRFGVSSIPRMFLLDRQGNLAAFNPRGRELWDLAAAQTGHDGPKPPNYDRLLADFEAADADARKQLSAHAVRFAPAFEDDTASAFDKAMMDWTKPVSSEVATMALEVARRMIGVSGDPIWYDIGARSAHQLGMHEEARSHQLRAVEIVGRSGRARLQRMGQDSAGIDDVEIFLAVTKRTESIGLLALVENELGNLARAEELLVFVARSNAPIVVEARGQVQKRKETLEKSKASVAPAAN
ncbi:MAG: TlpA family protein disulfide reductase [Candidatus Sumerlaeia bacterium]|nr:TlpA family protein disulfide reductase [Candidatus Sumerlaeia bacterium]